MNYDEPEVIRMPDGRQNNGGNHGGGGPVGYTSKPLKASKQDIIEASAQLIEGSKPQEVAKALDLPVAEVRRIESLTHMIPEEYFQKVSTKLQARAEKLLDHMEVAMEQEVERGTAKVKDTAIAYGIFNDQLMKIEARGKPSMPNSMT